MALSLQDVLDKASKKAASTQFQRTAKPKPGRSVWRILPGWDSKNPNQFFHAYGQHFIKDMEGKLKVVIGCPDKTFDEPCEICDAIQEAARNAPNDKMREKILESRSTQRFLFNAINVDEDPTKVEILEVGSGLFRDFIANIQEDETLIDADGGRDFVINREGSGLNTRYSLAVRSKDKSIKVNKSVLMSLNNLEEYVTEDFEAKKKKALTALGVATGAALAGSSAAGALTDESDLDDEIPDFGAEEARKEAMKEIEDADVSYEDEKTDEAEEKTAAPEEKSEAADSFGEDISDDDIESMLADLD